MLLATALLLIMFSKTSAYVDKNFCFSSFCLAKDYDKDVAPAKNYTIKLTPIVQDIYEVS